MNRELAKALIEGIINRECLDAGEEPRFAVLDDATIEKEWGWVFFYQSKEYLQTNDPRGMLAGNAPYIFNKKTGEYRVTGTALPIEQYIQEYEASLKTG